MAGQRLRTYTDIPAPELTFQPGDLVHDETGAIGVVEFLRSQDGWACLRWPSGRHSWVPSDRICGPLQM